MPMNIFINGKTFSLTAVNEKNVAQALTLFLSQEQTQTTFAVALNSQFVSKTNYESTQLTDGDALDVLFPIVGG